MIVSEDFAPWKSVRLPATVTELQQLQQQQGNNDNNNAPNNSKPAKDKPAVGDKPARGSVLINLFLLLTDFNCQAII